GCWRDCATWSVLPLRPSRLRIKPTSTPTPQPDWLHLVTSVDRPPLRRAALLNCPTRKMALRKSNREAGHDAQNHWCHVRARAACDLPQVGDSDQSDHSDHSDHACP